MENTATNRQLFMVIVIVVVSFSCVHIPKVITQSAGEGGWLVILAAAVFFSASAYAIASLHNMFPGKMVFEYSRQLVGKAAAYVISSMLAAYFASVAVVCSILLGNLLQTNYLPETPTLATEFAIIPIAGFVAYKGITNVARLLEIYGLIFLSVAIPTYIVMLLQGDMNHILPLFSSQEAGRYLNATKTAILPFIGFEVMYVIPFTDKNKKKSSKTAALGIAAAGLFYLLDLWACVAIIGENEILHYNFPLITAIRQVTLPQLKLFARLDILYLTVGFLGIVGSMSFIYLSAVELVCRMAPKMSRLLVVTLVAAVIFIGDVFARKVDSIYDTLRGILSVWGLATAVVLPVALIVIARVKKNAKSG